MTIDDDILDIYTTIVKISVKYHIFYKIVYLYYKKYYTIVESTFPQLIESYMINTVINKVSPGSTHLGRES